MSKILHFFIFTLSIIGTAQTKETSPSSILNKKDEVRLDVGKLLTNSRIQISYEHFLNKDFSVGCSAMTLNKNSNENEANDHSTNTIRKYQIEPYVRYSLSKNNNKFFYVETFASVNGGTTMKTERLFDGTYGYYAEVKKRYNDVALGVALGYKFYIKKSFCVDFILGGGQNLFNEDSPEIVSRVGLNIGYRF